MSPMMMRLWPVPAYVILAGIFWGEAYLRGYVAMSPLELYGMAWLTGVLLFGNVEYIAAVWPMVQRRWRLEHLSLDEHPTLPADDLKEQPGEGTC